MCTLRLQTLCGSGLPHALFPFGFVTIGRLISLHLTPLFFHVSRLQKLVDNGPHPPPGETGAKFIIREDGRRINLAFMKAGADRRLELGDKVHGGLC